MSKKKEYKKITKYYGTKAIFGFRNILRNQLEMEKLTLYQAGKILQIIYRKAD